ncbi:hypothetical protein OY671_009066, partial [Metschnikowia pulcherrima]
MFGSGGPAGDALKESQDERAKAAASQESHIGSFSSSFMWSVYAVPSSASASIGSSWNGRPSRTASLAAAIAGVATFGSSWNSTSSATHRAGPFGPWQNSQPARNRSKETGAVHYRFAISLSISGAGIATGCSAQTPPKAAGNTGFPASMSIVDRRQILQVAGFDLSADSRNATRTCDDKQRIAKVGIGRRDINN